MLPFINTPTYKVEMPNGKALTIRQILAGEYKILLDALVRGSDDTVALSVGDVIARCVKDPDFKFADLTISEVEWLFMQMYKHGVDSNIRVQMRCEKDGCDTTFGLPIPIEEIEFSKPVSNVVEVADGVVIKLKEPCWQEWYSLQDKSADGPVLAMVIEQVWHNDQCFTLDNSEGRNPESTFTTEELVAWADSLTTGALDGIVRFINNAPQLKWERQITCPACGNVETVKLTGLDDFFG